MEKLKFHLLTYHLEAQIFLGGGLDQMFLHLYLGVVVFEMFVSHTVPLHTYSTSRKLCHTCGLTHTTPQLRLRPARSMFAATDFEPSNLQFNIRWST